MRSRHWLPDIIAALVVVGLLLAIPTVPACEFLGVSPAWADDDDDDGRSRALSRAAPLPDYVPDEVLLMDPSEAALARSLELGFNVYTTEIIRGSQIIIARLRPPSGLDALSALALLRREAPGQIADLNHLYRQQQSVAPKLADDAHACGSARCYGQVMIGWSTAMGACGDGLKIGMLDTGVDASHPSLRGQSLTSVSFASLPARPSGTQHGTAIAALLAGNGDGGVLGLLPKARLFVADVFHTAAGNQLSADAVSIARGLGWLKSRGVSVINISLAGGENWVLDHAVKDAITAGIGIVAAAGNDGPSAPARYPAAIPGIVAITAVDERRRAYRRAAQGPHIAFAAPGVNVWTAQPRGHQGMSTGTSFAAPFATAVLAIIRDAGRTGANDMPVQDLGAPGVDPVFGRGLIQAPRSCGTATSTN